MKTKNLFTILLLFIGVSIFAQNSDDKKVIKDSQDAKKAFLEANPKLETYFDDAKAYVIFPNIGKGAIIVGAASGNGAVYERGVLVGMADLKQLDIGAQIGGKAFSEVIFFKTDAAVQDFMDGEYKLSGNISAVAANQSTPSLDLKYEDGVAVFTLSKEGLMAEVSVGGQRLAYKGFKQ